MREISKLHQESIRGSLSEIVERLVQGVKGEMALVVEGAGEAGKKPSDSWQGEAEAMLDEGRTVKTIVSEITDRYGAPKNAVKEFLLKRSQRR